MAILLGGFALAFAVVLVGLRVYTDREFDRIQRDMDASWDNLFKKYR